MTIYAPRPAPFTCAICCEPQMGDGSPWSVHCWAGSYPIPPLCNSCARTWGRAIGGIGDLNRDRRIIRQIFALAEALQTEAFRQLHKGPPIHA